MAGMIFYGLEETRQRRGESERLNEEVKREVDVFARAMGIIYYILG